MVRDAGLAEMGLVARGDVRKFRLKKSKRSWGGDLCIAPNRCPKISQPDKLDNA